MKDTNLDGKCGSCLYHSCFWRYNKDFTKVRLLAWGPCEDRNVYKWRTETCKKYINNTWYNRLWRKLRG